jgi:thiamine biosynthesis protein ThiS
MRIMVNGQWRTEDGALTVTLLLEKLSVEPRRCAVELNKQLVPRTAHGQTALKDDDRLEIVTLVGGG